MNVGLLALDFFSRSNALLAVTAVSQCWGNYLSTGLRKQRDCTTEEVIFSGTQQIVLQEVNGHQTAQVQYLNVHGVGAETGTQ